MPAVLVVKAYGVAGKEPLHNGGNMHFARAKEQMDMLRDERPGQALGLRFDNNRGKPIDEICSVSIRAKDLPALDAAHNYMMHRSLCIDSGFSWHIQSLSI